MNHSEKHLIFGSGTQRELATLELKNEKHFRMHQQAAIASDLIEMPLPDKPNSRCQKYRLTENGHALLH